MILIQSCSRFTLGTAIISIALSGCANSTFSSTSNGNAEHFAGSHTTLQTQAATQVLHVCGDYPVVIGASDTGGSVCIAISFDANMLAAMGGTRTLTISGDTVHTASGSEVITTFTPSAGHSAEITAVTMEHNCSCAHGMRESFNGTVTLDAIEAHRLAGSLSVDLVENLSSTPSTSRIEAHFDARE